MPLLSLREHGKLRIGEFDLATPTVTSGQALHLRALKRVHGFDVFKSIDEETIAAQQYVGAVQVGNLTVEVLPKIDGIDGTAMRRNLVGMLAVVLDLRISDGDIAQVATQSHGILEVLIRLYCDMLFKQVHRGLVRRYEQREENLSVLRGKIGLMEQIRLNAANPERLYCCFDEFQEDNPLNQILKAATRLLLEVSNELSNQRKLAELLLVFEGVMDVPRPSLPWHRVAFDRLNERYKVSFRLAELFLKSTPPDVSGGRVQGFSLFFDMNNLFEEYIGRVAKRVFAPHGYNVILQSPQRYLAYDETLQRGAFLMKPDVVALVGQRRAWIIDTKWKELSADEAREGVSQGDFYQMYAYLCRYDCPLVVLLYPHHEGLGARKGIRASYRVNAWEGKQDGQEDAHVEVGTVDLADLSTIPDQLRMLVRRADSVRECEDALVA